MSRRRAGLCQPCFPSQLCRSCTILSLILKVPKLRIKLERRLKPYCFRSKEGYIFFSSSWIMLKLSTWPLFSRMMRMTAFSISALDVLALFSWTK